MKKLSFLLIAFVSFQAYGQNTLLFKISGNGIDKPSYLFGTMHVTDEKAFGWNDSVFWAINQVDVAAFELDFEAKSLQKKVKPSKAQMKEWQTFLVDDLRPSIENAIPADTLGSRIAGLYSEILKEVLIKDKSQRGTFVDMFLKEYAEKMGKEVVGIESVKEQLDIFLDMDKSLLKRDIMKFIEEDNWDVDVSMIMGNKQAMVDAYSTKQLTDVCNFLSDQMKDGQSELTSSLYTRMFDDRNAIMVKRVSKMVNKQSHFIAVGAGHLCDNSGLVNQLKKAGYTLTPIDITTETESSKINWVGYENENYSVQVPQGVSAIDPADNPDDVYSYYLTGNPDATFYTTKGKAVFKIEKVDNTYEMEEAYEYVEEADETYSYDTDEDEAIEYAGEEEEVEIETIDEEAFGDIKYDETAEAMEAAEDAMEAVAEDAEYMEVETEEVEEYAYDEQDEVVDDYDYGYDEVEEAPEDSDYGSSMRKKKSGNDLKDAFNNEYWQTVSKAVMSKAMAQMMMEAMAGKGEEAADDGPMEQEVTVMGETHKIIAKNSFLGYSKTMQVETDNGTYEITISGDPMLLDSGSIDAFFTSFQLK